jgi:hypothetical protein
MPSRSSESSTTTDKRSFFRVKSELALSYHNVDAFTAENGAIEEEFPEDSSNLTLFTELKRIDSDASTLLSQIAEKSRPTADYLSLMSKKLDLITRQLVADQYLDSNINPSHVNISEGGAAFKSQKSIYKGSYVALRLLFTSSFTVIAVFARVIRCDKLKDGNYQIAIKFTRLSTPQQELLAKHILQAQLQAKRVEQNKQKD